MKCPYCNQEIQDSAKKCRFCGKWLKVECPECHEWVDREQLVCPNCGIKLNAKINQNASKQCTKIHNNTLCYLIIGIIAGIAIVLFSYFVKGKFNSTGNSKFMYDSINTDSVVKSDIDSIAFRKHLSFEGILLNGPLEDFQKEAQQKGIYLNPSGSYEQHEFKGVPSLIYPLYDKKSHHLYGVDVFYMFKDNDQGWSQLGVSMTTIMKKIEKEYHCKKTEYYNHGYNGGTCYVYEIHTFKSSNSKIGEMYINSYPQNGYAILNINYKDNINGLLYGKAEYPQSINFSNKKWYNCTKCISEFVQDNNNLGWADCSICYENGHYIFNVIIDISITTKYTYKFVATKEDTKAIDFILNNSDTKTSNHLLGQYIIVAINQIDNLDYEKKDQIIHLLDDNMRDICRRYEETKNNELREYQTAYNRSIEQGRLCNSNNRIQNDKLEKINNLLAFMKVFTKEKLTDEEQKRIIKMMEKLPAATAGAVFTPVPTQEEMSQ